MPRPQAPIAVVDDDARFLEALRNLLDALGFETKGYSSAREFLDSTPVERFACLILDVELEGTSGLELQHQLKTSQPTLPIIVMTGSANALAYRAAGQSGCAAFLQKPFGASEIVAAIDRIHSLATPPST